MASSTVKSALKCLSALTSDVLVSLLQVSPTDCQPICCLASIKYNYSHVSNDFSGFLQAGDVNRGDQVGDGGGIWPPL